MITRRSSITQRGSDSGLRAITEPEIILITATAIAVDGSGNVYVTGASTSDTGRFDYVTIKDNSAGQQQWVAYDDGPENSDDIATAIAIDGAGNTYVTGYSYGSVGSDYATIKYNSAGQQQWARRYNGPANYRDQATAIAVDAIGNVYVTGVSVDSGGYDYATINDDAAGLQQWIARYNGPGDFDDIPTAMAIDGAGNTYVTGYSRGSVGEDYATIKYNSAGQQQWVRRYDGPAHSDDEATAIAIDGSGSIYVTGFSTSSAGSDYATIKDHASGHNNGLPVRTARITVTKPRPWRLMVQARLRNRWKLRFRISF